MTKKRYRLNDDPKLGYAIQDTSIPDRMFLDDFNDIVKELNRLSDESERLAETNQKLYDKLQKTMTLCSLKKIEVEILEEFISDLATKGTNRIDLSNGYSYSIEKILEGFKK